MIRVALAVGRLDGDRGEEDRGVGIGEVVVAADAATDDLLGVAGQVVGEAEARRPVVLVVLQLAALAAGEVLEVALGVLRLGGERLPERAVALIDIEARPEVVAQADVEGDA